MNSSKSNSFY